MTSYHSTRNAWRDIWVQNSDFERELETLEYKPSRELLDAYLPFLSTDGIILEAGCGLGHVVYYLRQRKFNVVGIDYVSEALHRELVTRLALPLMVADVHHLPYPDNSLCGYLSFGVVEHFEDGPTGALNEAFRVLRPGGVLVLTVPHPNFVEFLRNFANWVIPGRLERVGKRAEYYETQYGHRTIADLISKAGFQVQRSMPLSHSFTWYGLSPIFRAPGYYKTSELAELFGSISARLFPWLSCSTSLTIAHKA